MCWSRLPTLQVLVLGLNAGRGPAQRHLHAPRARGVGGPRGLPGALPGERARCGRDRKVREGAQCSTMREALDWPYAMLSSTVPVSPTCMDATVRWPKDRELLRVCICHKRCRCRCRYRRDARGGARCGAVRYIARGHGSKGHERNGRRSEA